jgi:hypothetical protein
MCAIHSYMTQPIAVARYDGISTRDMNGGAKLLHNSISLSYPLVELNRSTMLPGYGIEHSHLI